METKQTAVEWLIKEFNLEPFEATIKLAKSMEREQILKAYQDGIDKGFYIGGGSK